MTEGKNSASALLKMYNDRKQQVVGFQNIAKARPQKELINGLRDIIMAS